MTDKRKERCRVVIYPASRERHNKPYWPYARHCLRPAREGGLCKQADGDLYRQAVHIGHLAMIDFGGADELRRAAEVEAAVMSLIASAKGIDV